jgi:hypothetical protein
MFYLLLKTKKNEMMLYNNLTTYDRTRRRASEKDGDKTIQ